MQHVRWYLIDPPPYEVTCLEEDESAGEGHSHVVAVETTDPDGGQTRWPTVEVIAAMRDGVLFTVGESERSTLEAAVCPKCETATIAVGPGGAAIAPCS